MDVGALAMAPLLLVFYFSVVFLNRGIDSWFHVEVREGLNDALDLSRAALDLRMREYSDAHARASPTTSATATTRSRCSTKRGEERGDRD